MKHCHTPVSHSSGVMCLYHAPFLSQNHGAQGSFHGSFSHDSPRVKGKWLGSRPYLSFWAISGPPGKGSLISCPESWTQGLALAPVPRCRCRGAGTWPSVSTIPTYHRSVQAPASPSPAPVQTVDAAPGRPRPAPHRIFRPRSETQGRFSK